jgi:tetratricopeptide (TPR) repeat protein
MSIDSTLSRRMTMAPEVSSRSRFVPTVLPWLIAAGAVVLYAFTLNHWVTFNSLGTVARVSGWRWQPDLSVPLYWLVTFPFRWLTPKLIPIALNLFAAVCGGLTLALLARSVALLPHDRTEEQRIRERSAYSILSTPTAWVPPLFAAIVCGLQLTFWENATAASADMLDLLLFAYIIRCVLEFRVAERDSWLYRAAFVFGLAMVENWAMIAFFPVFLAVLVWIMGLNFFNARFLVRMFLLGMAGLSLYLVLPIVNSVSGAVHVGFWQGLGAVLRGQKFMLFTLPFNKFAMLHGLPPANDHPLWVLALPSLLPVLAIGVRWPAYFGDPSKMGVALATTIFHVLHGALLLFCVYVALDPQFSPRHYHPMLLANGILMLPFYYLGALSVGYFTGYLLLVFGAKPHGRPRLVSAPMQVITPAVFGAVCLVAVAAPVVLAVRNLPQIRVTNGRMYERFASFLSAPLTGKNPAVLSDDPIHLWLLRSAMTRSGQKADCMFIDTAALHSPEYHRLLKKDFPGRWVSNPPRSRKTQMEDPELLGLMYQVGVSNTLYYLHPSFGYYFELYHPEAHGLVSKMIPYKANVLTSPPLGGEVITENEAFWKQAEAEALGPIYAATAPPSPHKHRGWAEVLMQKAHLEKDVNPGAATLASWYARSLDAWGVQLQRSGQLEQAAAHFARALELNPDNIIAQINLECNKSLQAGRKLTVEDSSSIQDKFGKYRDWDPVMRANGPFDEPSFCYQTGVVSANVGNRRQAAQEFMRAIQMAPDDLRSRVFLAQNYVILGMAEPALKIFEEIRAHPATFDLGRSNQTTLLFVEASAHLVNKDLLSAEKLVQTTLDKYPGDQELLGVAASAYLNYKHYSNALGIIEQQLKIQPDNVRALINKGNACMALTNYQAAIAPWTRLLALETNSFSGIHGEALYARAVSYLQTTNLDGARRDLETLEKTFPNWYVVYYSLGHVAYKMHDTNAAIRHYQLYQNSLPSDAPTNTPEYIESVAHLQELRHSLK